MKKAVIVVGSHCTGKSKTINLYFKPLVGLSGRQQYFKNRAGRVLSQTLEESNKLVDHFINYAKEQTYFVCAARPDGENPSLYKELKVGLEEIGFNVFTVNILGFKEESFYEDRAKGIVNALGI